MGGDNTLGKLYGAISGMKEAAKNAKAARDNEKRQLDLIKSLDWKPTTSAELTPTYQRTQSPVARGYLESFLMGNNPDSVMPGDPMAAQKQRQMQYSQNQMFGTPEQRVQQQNAYRATTPWQIDPKQVARQQAKKEESRAASAFTAGNPDAAALGLDEKLYNKLQDAGVFEGFKGVSEQASDNPDVVRHLAEVGDYDALKTLVGKYEGDGGRPVKDRRRRKDAERRAQGVVDRTRAYLRGLDEAD